MGAPVTSPTQRMAALAEVTISLSLPWSLCHEC